MEKQLFCLLVIPIFALAQNDFQEHLSTYSSISFNYFYNEKWSSYTEFQARGIEDVSNIDYIELKQGVFYNLNKNHRILLGISKSSTYRNYSLHVSEIRPWVDYKYSFRMGKTRFKNRFRAERRYFHYPKTGKNRDANRFLYRFMVTYPLNNKNMQNNTIFLNIYNQAVVGSRNGDSWFKRNEVYMGVGYRLNNYVNTRLGYLWQRNFSYLRGLRDYHFIYWKLDFMFDRIKYRKDKQY